MAEDRHSGVPGGNGSGANVKSGVIPAVDDGAAPQVIFATAFASIPSVVITLEKTGTFGNDAVVASNVTATGFYAQLVKNHGGSGHTYDVRWIATDAGDP